MKKLILMLFIFSAVFGFSCRFRFCAYTPNASDIKVKDLPDNQTDSVGHVTDGSIVFRIRGNSGACGTYGYFENCKYIYITKDGSDPDYTYNIYAFRDTSTDVITFKTGNLYDNDIPSEPVWREVLFQAISGASEIELNQNAYNEWFTIYGSQGGFWVTNIPIFSGSDTSGIQAYKDNGDTSSALNKNDLVPQPSYTSNIPRPSKISISDSSMQQKQNVFVNNVDITVDSGLPESFSGTCVCEVVVDLNLVRYQTILGSTQTTILYSGNQHSNNNNVTTVVVSYSNGKAKYSVPVSALNAYCSKIYQYNNIDVNTSVTENHIYLNQLSIRARNKYSSGNAFVVGSWSSTLDFTYNYMTKSASGFESEYIDSTEDATVVPNVTPNDETGNGFDNNTGAQITNGKFDGTITNDYPKWDLYHKLTSLFSNDNQIKQSVDSGFNNITDNLSFSSLLSTVMPFMGNDYWDLIRLAMTMGIGVTGVRCVYKFLRG